MQLTTVGKLKKGSLYLKNNLSEEQPVEYDKLILYLSLKSGLLSTKIIQKMLDWISLILMMGLILMGLI